MGHDAHGVPRPAGVAAPGSHLDHDLDHDVEEVIAAVLTASRLLVGISARALGRTAPSLTLPQLRALVVLESQGPVKLASLAGALGVNPSTAMRMVDRLEAAGSVTRQANPGNRREVVLSLTEPGRALVEEVLAARHTEIAAIVSRLPAGERAGLIGSLRALTDAAGEPPVAPRPAPPPESAAP
ncbi:MarR family transcriptional regulator [Streptomyces sp. TM32]|uniref:MarR family winged helix-turn-helix transcriptional regulator n=1 Tax=Streptomyces sp. TM32 TaxID=1652669 RepID=UPI001011E47A|nr:MarR family transcriptional regulator [Streptomyces sp. TM32]RXS72653.1 MarR family transcriptional regulator [Streptomyces sp. TM32]